jgi:hypothetical protein
MADPGDQLDSMLRGFTEFEQGERQALLELRSFIINQSQRLKGKRLVDEIDAYCATRLSDLRADAINRIRSDG